jgi:hypothetical protein
MVANATKLAMIIKGRVCSSRVVAPRKALRTPEASDRSGPPWKALRTPEASDRSGPPYKALRTPEASDRSGPPWKALRGTPRSISVGRPRRPAASNARSRASHPMPAPWRSQDRAPNLWRESGPRSPLRSADPTHGPVDPRCRASANRGRTKPAYQASASWMEAKAASANKMAPGSATDSMVWTPRSADEGNRTSGPVRIRGPRPTATVILRNIIAPIPTSWFEAHRAYTQPLVREISRARARSGTSVTTGQGRNRRRARRSGGGHYGRRSTTSAPPSSSRLRSRQASQPSSGRLPSASIKSSTSHGR